MIYFCCDRLRREAVDASPLNGIDYLEVLDADAPSLEERQRTLYVHFLHPLAGAPLQRRLKLERPWQRSKSPIPSSTWMETK